MTKYIHAVAGSTVITPTGKVLRFYGKPGTVGELETDIPEETSMLDYLARHPQTQIEFANGDNLAVTKPAAPEIAQSVQDAAAPSLHATDAAVEAAQNRLAAVIAGSAS